MSKFLTHQFIATTLLILIISILTVGVFHALVLNSGADDIAEISASDSHRACGPGSNNSGDGTDIEQAYSWDETMVSMKIDGLVGTYLSDKTDYSESVEFPPEVYLERYIPPA